MCVKNCGGQVHAAVEAGALEAVAKLAEGRAAAGIPPEWYDLERRLEDFAELEGAAAAGRGGGGEGAKEAPADT